MFQTGCGMLPRTVHTPSGSYGSIQYPVVRASIVVSTDQPEPQVAWYQTPIAFAEMGQAQPRAELLRRLDDAKLFASVTPVEGGPAYRPAPASRRPFQPAERFDFLRWYDHQFNAAFAAIVRSSSRRRFVLVAITSADASCLDWQFSPIDLLTFPAFILPSDNVNGQGHATFWVIDTATNAGVASGTVSIRLSGHTPPAFASYARQTHLAKTASALDGQIVNALRNKLEIK